MRIIIGNALADSCKVLEPHAVDYKELHVFELMMVLEREGWTCAVADKAMRKSIRQSPYDCNTSPLTWYVDDKGNSPPKLYLVALLSSVPGSTVPHFASTAVYATLFDAPLTSRKKRKTMLQRVDDDDLEVMLDTSRKSRRTSRHNDHKAIRNGNEFGNRFKATTQHKHITQQQNKHRT